jgi:tetrapyrrole methylase family protein / MazG family protein
MIKIVGLGPGSEEDLTIRSINVMKNANNLYLRTEKHPNVEYIKGLGIKFDTFDELYEVEEEFDLVYDKIARHIVDKQDVVYAVPGHPLVAEKSVQLILKYAGERGIEVNIIPALSFIDAVVSVMGIDPVEGLKILDGLQIGPQKPDLNVGNIITQVYNRLTASEIKIKLMEFYSDEHEVYLIRAAGVKDLEKIEAMPLYGIDRVEWVDYLTSLYIPPVKEKTSYEFADLLDVMDTLRGENGCPWDIEQTHESLKKYLLEECYEVIDAIDKDNMENLCEELGDVMLQVVFHSQIAKEFGEFEIRDVISSITDKMIKRHRHIFGDDKCSNAEEVLDNWEKIKKEEKNIKSHTENLKQVPVAFPSLMRSFKIQERAAKVGFDWDNVDDALAKVHEELKELLEVYKSGKNDKILEELGDLLFAVVNVSRFLEINPEMALTKTIEKFIKRFEYIEKSAEGKGRKMEEMTLEDMDELWNEAKTAKF